MASINIGGVSSTFTGGDEFLAPLRRAAEQVAKLQSLLDAKVASSRNSVSGMPMVAAALPDATPALRGFGVAAARTMSTLRSGIADLAVSSTALESNIVGVAANAKLTAAGADASTRFGAMATVAGRLDTVLGKVQKRMAALSDRNEAVAIYTAGARHDRKLLSYSGGGLRLGIVRGDEATRAARQVGTTKNGGSMHSSSLGIVYLMYKAFQKALKTENRATTNVKLFDPAVIHNAARLMLGNDIYGQLAFRTSPGTIYSAKQIGHADDVLATILAVAPTFHGVNKWKSFRTPRPLLPCASAVASTRGPGSLQGNTSTSSWFPHTTSSYALQLMPLATSQMLATAERTEVRAPTHRRIMTDSLAIAHGPGQSVSHAALLTNALIDRGLGETAEYSVREMQVGASKTGGLLAADWQAALSRLGLRSVAFKGAGLSSQLAALHKAGVLDTNGKFTIPNATGGFDVPMMPAAFKQTAKPLVPQIFEQALHAGFALRGMRTPALLDAIEEQHLALNKAVAAMQTALELRAASVQTLQQKFEHLLARLKGIGNMAATGFIAVRNRFPGVIVPILRTIDSYLGKHSTSSAVGGGAAGGTWRLSAWKPVPQHMSGWRGSNAALFRDPTNVTINYAVSITAPPGGDDYTIGQHVKRVLKEHVDDLVNNIKAQQTLNGRRTFLDQTYSFGGYGP